MTKPFVNVAEVPLSPHPAARPGSDFDGRFAQIAAPLDGES
jgi:hypothetical protein